MDNLKHLLREVLQEELVPITSQITRMNERLDGVDTQLVGLNERLEDLDKRMETRLERIELNQSQDILVLLKLIDDKLTTKSSDQENRIELLNERLFKVEADVRKLSTS